MIIKVAAPRDWSNLQLTRYIDANGRYGGYEQGKAVSFHL